MVARVAIDLALGRLFDYAVPEALEKKLAVGQLLSVPFGHREARAFLIEILDDESSGKSGDGSYSSKGSFKLKNVTAILDETPFFSPSLLTVVRKVASYTASPIEKVLRAAVPAAVLKKGARAKELFFVEPVCIKETKSLTARQKWIVENIARLGGGWLASICRELSTTPSTLKSLAARGFIKIEQKAKRRDPLAGRRIIKSSPLRLNEEQSQALAAIPVSTENRGTVLLFGVTGSGKTEVYLQAIARELSAGRGAVVLVPEISRTPQTVQRFASRFGSVVAVLHSALSDGERYDEWHRIRSGEARVVVGPRSAVWAPVRNLGLIVVDEEHETSYKQDESPRYNARDVAVLRGAIEGASVVLGSATPSLESWMNVKRGKYSFAQMKNRAGAGTLPFVRLVDMHPSTTEASKGAIFSPELLDAMRTRLDNGEQTILFLNRRGYARSVVCDSCGISVDCPKCSVPYTYHRADSCLRCHVCGGWVPVPKVCPECASTSLSFVGVGTQRVQVALTKCFPHARVLRMDADSTSRRDSHEDILGKFRRGEADILIGTQMIAKGLDFPKVTLVGVINADSSLAMAGSDFRAAERTYQLISQVAGRAGRAELPGEVFVQSRDATVPVLGYAARGDYVGFAADELKVRKECCLPPFCHLAAINFSSRDSKLVASWAEMYAKSLVNYSSVHKELLVGEAMPSPLEKADGRYRWQVVLRAPSTSLIIAAWRWIVGERPWPNELRASIDIDAFNLV